MDIAVDISLYPLERDFVPPIQDFIDRLAADARLKVVTNSLSTQVSGPYDRVMACAGARDCGRASRDSKASSC